MPSTMMSFPMAFDIILYPRDMITYSGPVISVFYFAHFPRLVQHGSVTQKKIYSEILGFWENKFSFCNLELLLGERGRAW